MELKLKGYTPVPSTATVGGAPIDAFQADAFRTNDILFEKHLRAILSAPFIPNGADGPVKDPPAAHRLINATTITVTEEIKLNHDIPLIWLASEEILIQENGKIVARQGEGDGMFGGSGSGSTSEKGYDCINPFIGDAGTPQLFLEGGSKDNSGKNFEEAADWNIWQSRALSRLAFCKGGAQGGPAGTNDDEQGSLGGGVVVLCAPRMEIHGSINAGGMDIAANASNADAGCGGGGLVVLISLAYWLEKIKEKETDLIRVTGGVNGKHTALKGGNGTVLYVGFE